MPPYTAVCPLSQRSQHKKKKHAHTHNAKKGDLEDKILKKNIPGKYTWWDKDSDEEGEGARADWVDREASDPEAELTELQKQKKWVDNDCPEPIRRTIMARQEKERARTGVKGVLADYDAWKLSADAGAKREELCACVSVYRACVNALSRTNLYVYCTRIRRHQNTETWN